MPEEPVVLGRDGSYSKGIARRQEILDRAIEVFAERGAYGTSLRQIASVVGVSHGTLLHYFDSREQLLVAVYEHAEQRRLAAGEMAEETGAVDALLDAARTNLLVPGLVQLYTTLVATALEDGSDTSKAFFTARFERTRNDLADRIRREQDAGRVRTDVDAAAIAALLVAASDGLQVQWLLDENVGLSSILGVFETLLRP